MMIDTSESSDGQNSDVPIMFWITLAPGIMVITLGVTLWIQPGKIRPFLITFMGMFWLPSGVL